MQLAYSLSRYNGLRIANLHSRHLYFPVIETSIFLFRIRTDRVGAFNFCSTGNAVFGVEIELSEAVLSEQEAGVGVSLFIAHGRSEFNSAHRKYGLLFQNYYQFSSVPIIPEIILE